MAKTGGNTPPHGRRDDRSHQESLRRRTQKADKNQARRKHRTGKKEKRLSRRRSRNRRGHARRKTPVSRLYQTKVSRQGIHHASKAEGHWLSCSDRLQQFQRPRHHGKRGAERPEQSSRRRRPVAGLV